MISPYTYSGGTGNSNNFATHYSTTNTRGGRLRYDGLGNKLSADETCAEDNGINCDQTYNARRTRTNSPMGLVQREKITGAGYEVKDLLTSQVGSDANGIQANWQRECKGLPLMGNECEKHQ